MITFGSGQTSGQPLALTAVTLGTAQVLHTFIAGSGTPEEVEVLALNSDSAPRTLTLALYNSGATLVRSWSVDVPVGASLVPVFDTGEEYAALVCNGTTVLKAFADVTATLAVCARVNTQAATTDTIGFGSGQTSGQPLAITAVTLGTAQVLHTFPAGTANPQVLNAFGFNADTTKGAVIHLALYDVSAVLVRQWAITIGAESALQPLFGHGEEHDALVCNGTTVLKAYADATGIGLTARVITQV